MDIIHVVMQFDQGTDDAQIGCAAAQVRVDAVEVKLHQYFQLIAVQTSTGVDFLRGLAKHAMSEGRISQRAQVEVGVVIAGVRVIGLV